MVPPPKKGFSKVVSTHLWNTPRKNLYQQAISRDSFHPLAPQHSPFLCQASLRSVGTTRWLHPDVRRWWQVLGPSSHRQARRLPEPGKPTNNVSMYVGGKPEGTKTHWKVKELHLKREQTLNFSIIYLHLPYLSHFYQLRDFPVWIETGQEYNTCWNKRKRSVKWPWQAFTHGKLAFYDIPGIKKDEVYNLGPA